MSFCISFVDQIKIEGDILNIYLISTCSTYNVLLYLSIPCQHLPGSSIAEIQLSRALLPRVAAVNVQGLRLSLPPTRHEVRFSPLKTLPVRVEISSGNFSAHLAWSTLPGSIISVPPGAGCRDVDVGSCGSFWELPSLLLQHDCTARIVDIHIFTQSVHPIGSIVFYSYFI